MWGNPSTVKARPALRGGLTALALVATVTAAGSPASATHEERALEVTPEVERHKAGSKVVLKARIDPSASGTDVPIDFEITSGPNARIDKNGPDSPQTPDLSCTVKDGSSSCSVSYKGKKASGVDEVLAWVDHDDDDSSVEADEAERADSGGPPDEPGCPESECGPPDTAGQGSTEDPDSTDRVLVLWGQMQATQPAVEDGPARFQTKGCDAAKDKNKRGRVIATAKACTFIYTVPAARDTSEERNFGSVWIQSQVDARRNWCVEKVKMGINVPDGARLEGVAPTKKTAIGNLKLVKVNLRVGNTSQVESVSQLSQYFYAYPDEMKTKASDGGDQQTLIWKGSTRKAQAFAIGLSISWLEADGAPDFSSAGGALKRFIVKKDACVPGKVG